MYCVNRRQRCKSIFPPHVPVKLVAAWASGQVHHTVSAFSAVHLLVHSMTIARQTETLKIRKKNPVDMTWTEVLKSKRDTSCCLSLRRRQRGGASSGSRVLELVDHKARITGTLQNQGSVLTLGFMLKWKNYIETTTHIITKIFFIQYVAKM